METVALIIPEAQPRLMIQSQTTKAWAALKMIILQTELHHATKSQKDKERQKENMAE
jgi:hypothetical protein